jgi:AcrR family transcriptional regulator
MLAKRMQSLPLFTMDAMPAKRILPPKLNRKSQIIAVAEVLLRQRGLSGVTTRAIAKGVPCSEGAIYVHFASRLQLLLTVLEESLPDMLLPLRALEGKVGVNTPQRNLTIAMQGLQKFHERMAPVLGSLFAEPELLHSFRQTLEARGKGPQGGITRIARYLQQEQALGRVAVGLDAETTAATLMSVSFFQAFTTALLGDLTPALSAKRVLNSLLQTGSKDVR